VSDRSQFRAVGLKTTLPRLKVMEILENSGERHMTAEDVYKEMLNLKEEIGLGTVYRVLNQFEQAGLVERNNFESGSSVFEIKSDSHHDHLVCMKCGVVEEFFDPSIEAQQEKVAKMAGFQIAGHSLSIYGFCSDCQE